MDHAHTASLALARAMRRIALCGPGDRLAAEGLEQCFGSRSLNVFILLQIYLARLSEAAARPLALASPCCRYMSPDEHAVLKAIGAVAAGDWAAAHCAIDPLVRIDAAEPVVAAAAWLAEALEDSGIGPLEPAAKPRLQ